MKDENTARTLHETDGEENGKTTVVWKSEAAEEEGAIDAAPEKRSLLARLKALPRIEDAAQRKAVLRIFWFLALMLVFTIVARGAAAATMPRVNVAQPTAGEIVQKVNGQATVKARGTKAVEGPENLSPEETLVEPGAAVEAGEPLARYNPEEVREQLAREEVNLEGMRVKLAALERNEPFDSSALAAAQRAFERAQEDYNRAVDNGAVAEAEAALEQARNRQQAAAKALAGLPAGEEREAAQEAFAAAQQAVTEAENGLATAQSSWEEAMRQAAQALEDARIALAEAQTQDGKARREANDTAAQNRVDAATQRLDIAKQEKKVSELAALAAAEGVLKAPEAGIVAEVPEAGGAAEGGYSVKLSSGAGGFEAEALVSKKEAEQVQVGDECEVTTGGGGLYYSPTATGRVTARSEPDENGQVKLTIKLPEGDWEQGKQVEMQVVHSRQNYSLCVPLSALHSDNSGYYLLTLEKETTVLGLEDKVLRVPVTVSAQDSENAAVEGPLSSGDQVVTGSDKPVEAGSKVRVNTNE